MKIYEPASQERAQLAHPIDSADFETINALVNGERRASSWKPLKFKLIDRNQGLSLHAVDVPWLGSHALIFKPAAILPLRRTLEAHGELLPLTCERSKLWVFNPTHVLDALDPLSSQVTRFPNGRVMWVTRYGFVPEQIRGVAIFKISDLRVSPTFVSDEIVDLFREHHLTGLDFTQVWDIAQSAA